jgi:ABC-type transport system involved in multi-copper enzyme maturation permease subunit
MYRTWVISAHTFKEAVFQPVYTLLIIFGAVVISVYSALPFFTFGEDTMMFKTVCLDLILLFVLVGTLFVTSRSIFEEIEDRTMLTLMSKPIRRWEVMLGKYFGIILAALLATTALGVVMGVGLWLRIPLDYQIRASSIDEAALRNLYEHRIMHLSGLVPSLVLGWMQISVLAAIGVAISTRFSLVVNLPAVLLIYVAGNLARFADAWQSQSGGILTKLALALSYVVPFLQVFDLREQAILSPIGLAGTQFAQASNAVSLGFLWTSVAAASVYAVAFVTFALATGLFFFRNRELGGSEG